MGATLLPSVSCRPNCLSFLSCPISFPPVLAVFSLPFPSALHSLLPACVFLTVLTLHVPLKEQTETISFISTWEMSLLHFTCCGFKCLPQLPPVRRGSRNGVEGGLAPKLRCVKHHTHLAHHTHHNTCCFNNNTIQSWGLLQMTPVQVMSGAPFIKVFYKFLLQGVRPFTFP